MGFTSGPVVKTLDCTAGGLGSIPCWGTKILDASWCGQKINKKQIKEEGRASFSNSRWVVSDSLPHHGLNEGCQAPLSMKYSRQKYWSELPFPSPNFNREFIYFSVQFDQVLPHAFWYTIIKSIHSWAFLSSWRTDHFPLHNAPHCLWSLFLLWSLVLSVWN